MLVQAGIDSSNSFCFHGGHRAVETLVICSQRLHGNMVARRTCYLHAFSDMQVACILRHAIWVPVKTCSMHAY